MQHTVIEYATLSWAVIGVSEQPPGFSLASLHRENETFEDTVERYVILYMAFWNITYAKDCRPQEPMSQEKAVKGKQKIEQYIKEHPPVIPLPKFYITFLNQPHIGCDADGFSDVFCL
ncbi:MAG: hypothetical protein IKY71_02880 [Bacteroidaceae bacterium]|nr:hypothetical protein [Bacteroidaceae bacterium]